MQLYELKNYQKTSLPLAAWLERPSRLYQVEHRHDCYEMVVVRTGTGWCAVNGQRFPMLRGDLYVLRPEDLHEFTNNPGMRFYNLMFLPSIFSEAEAAVLRPLLDWHGKYLLPCAAFDRVDPILAELCDELAANRPGDTVAAKALFLRFLVELLRLPTQESIAASRYAKNPRLTARLLAFVAEHYREKVTLHDLARETGGSPEYAGRLFKSLTGSTFTNYLIQFRIDLACSKLENTGATITEIATETGFFDTAYFDKCFRKLLGISPQAYRKQFSRPSSGSVAQTKNQ